MMIVMLVSIFVLSNVLARYNQTNSIENSYVTCGIRICMNSQGWPAKV